MNERLKIKIVQSLTGAIVLAILMQVFLLTGFGKYVWMLFLPLILFFALGADFKKIPSMIVCYICGVAWAVVNGILQNFFNSITSGIIASIMPFIIINFLVLIIHEGILDKTIFGNVPCVFLGLCTTIFTVFFETEVNGLHLIGFFLYGIIMSVALASSGMLVCSLIFGKERAMKVIAGNEEMINGKADASF